VLQKKNEKESGKGERETEKGYQNGQEEKEKCQDKDTGNEQSLTLASDTKHFEDLRDLLHIIIDRTSDIHQVGIYI